MLAYTTIKDVAVDELVEKRSRFIATIAPATTEIEAMAVVNAAKAEHVNARHNCWAYILRGNLERYSDDGEPQGTAGMPILEILRHAKIVDAVIVVTRYFGGTLLGTGGLARAYSSTAKLALNAATKITMQQCTLFSLEMPYNLYDRINVELENRGVVVLDSDFGACVRLNLRIPTHELAAFQSDIVELSRSQVIAQISGEVFA